MPQLHLTCFNTLQVTSAEEPITRFHSVKTRALLVYLAIEQGVHHPRETLEGLLWPDLSERRARRNLSQNLMELRRSIGDQESDPPFLLSDTQSIAFNAASDHWVDALVFDAHLITVDTHTVETHACPDPEVCPTCAEAL